MFTKLKHPLVITLVLFTFAYILVFPVGNFSINDDWLFMRQVLAFSTGLPKINALIDPTFILQGLAGLAWSKLFGVSFFSLRLLTFFVTLAFLCGVYKIGKFLELNSQTLTVVLLALAFNPLIFTSSMSFMTENYFLCLYAFSLYFYLKDKSYAGTLFTGLSILVRQVGVVTFIAFVLTSVLRKQVNKKKLILNFLVFVPFLVISVLWPRYENPTLFLLTNIKAYSLLLLVSLAYLAFFMSPVLVLVQFSLTRRYKILAMFVIGILTAILYKYDVFPLGNVLYVEGLYVKSNFKPNFSLFDNPVFKLLLAGFISTCVIRLALFLKTEGKKLVNSKSKLFLFLTALGMLGTLLVATDFYDRYLLSALVSLVFWVVACKPHFVKTKISTAVLGFFIVFTFFLQYEYIQQTKLRWSIAQKLKEQTGYNTQISVDNVFAKYMNVTELGDFTGLQKTMPVEDYLCYVQKYTSDDDSFLSKLNNPKIYGSKALTNIPKIKNHLNELMYNQEYFSPVFNLVGKHAFVGAWCNSL